MNSKDIILMGVKNLLRRKTRTLLTVLGVVIGAGSIVIMLSLGIAMQENARKNLEQYGSLTTVSVSLSKWDMESGEEKKAKDGIKLDEKAALAFEKIPNVSTAMGMMEASFQIKAGRLEGYMWGQAVDMDKLKYFDVNISKGRMMTGEDKNGILFGAESLKRFRNPKSRNRDRITIDPFEEKLLLFMEGVNTDKKKNGIKVEPIGIMGELNEEGYSRDENSWTTYVDINQYKEWQKFANKNSEEKKSRKELKAQKEKAYERIQVKVNEVENVADVAKSIEAMGYMAQSMNDWLEAQEKQTQGIRTILAGIGIVSLFIAAIGITNTMVMSIYERTKEIGVMKVLGAELRDIKRLFLFEAGMIGFFGGIAGIGASYLASWILNNSGLQIFGGGFGAEEVDQLVSIVPPWLAGASLLFATIIGLVSGYYPAVRAMKLSALEAIRNS